MPKRKASQATPEVNPEVVKKQKEEAAAVRKQERKEREDKERRERHKESMIRMNKESMEEYGMGWMEHIMYRCSEEEPINALVKRSSDRIEAGTRKFELWSSIARWTNRQHPALSGQEFFIDKPAKERRAMMARLIEYMTWRVAISKEIDSSTGSSILNPKTGKAKAMSEYSVIVLAMELDDLVQHQIWPFWTEVAKIKRAFQDLAVDLVVDNDLERSMHGVNEDDLAYYNRKELADYPDDEDFEAPAGREMRLLKARRLVTQWTFQEGRIEAKAAEGSATLAETVEALKVLDEKKKTEEEKEGKWDWPSDTDFAKKWDGIGYGGMSYWVTTPRPFAEKTYYH